MLSHLGMGSEPNNKLFDRWDQLLKFKFLPAHLHGAIFEQDKALKEGIAVHVEVHGVVATHELATLEILYQEALDLG